MGVGVYENDFYGAGTTFILSPTFSLTDDEYSEYKKDAEASVLEDYILSMEEWATEELDHFVDEAREVIADTLRLVGADSVIFHKNRDRLQADTEFMKVAEGAGFQIGIRSWETDYVVAITPASNLLLQLIQDGEEYDGQALEEFDCDIETLRDKHADQIAALKALIVLQFQELGEPFDCRYRTSGYTTSGFTKPDDVASARQEQIAKFEAAGKPSPSASPAPR